MRTDGFNFTGTSTERLAITGAIENGSTYNETDTGNIYERRNNVWLYIRTDLIDAANYYNRVGWTWATKPLATDIGNGYLFISDVGINGSLWRSDGVRWSYDSDIIIGQSGIPFVYASSGSIGNNGALTAITALSTTYSSAYFYFPANAISASSAAGWYYTVMSSTTAGTIYNNVYTSGNPEVPTTPTAFVTTGPGAYTQTTSSNIVGQSYTIQGGILGANGSLLIQNDIYTTVNANTKTVATRLDATALHTATVTSTAIYQQFFSMKNRGVADKQVCSRNNINIGTSSATLQFTFTSIDTSVNKDLDIIFNSAVATDNIVLEGYTFRLLPG